MTWFLQGMGLAALMLIAVAASSGSDHSSHADGGIISQAYMPAPTMPGLSATRTGPAINKVTVIDPQMFGGSSRAAPKKVVKKAAPRKVVRKVTKAASRNIDVATGKTFNNPLSAFFGRASPTKPVVTSKAKPLSPGSNYPATKNIQTQRSGFGSFLPQFQRTTGKNKYGVPIFLENGAVNPKYLAAERAAAAKQKRMNVQQAETKRKGLIASNQFELADYVRKRIGNVGSGKEYYESGK
jgi:hypothetical protein